MYMCIRIVLSFSLLLLLLLLRSLSFASLSRFRSFVKNSFNKLLILLPLPIGIDVAVFEHATVLSSRLVDFAVDGFAVVFGGLRVPDFESGHAAQTGGGEDALHGTFREELFGRVRFREFRVFLGIA